LGLPPSLSRDETVALEDTQQVRQVLSPCRAWPVAKGQSFVLAFDQVDNLEREQFAALARFLEALLDSAPNLLVVTAGIQATLAWVGEEKVVQDRPGTGSCSSSFAWGASAPPRRSKLVRSRLDNFLAPFTGIERCAVPPS